MDKKLLILMLTIFVTSTSIAQITAGVPDDFDAPATVQGWKHGDFGGSPNPPSLQTVGGIDANYLKNTSTGVGGVGGGKFIMLNTTQWTGDYITAGIKSISMQVKNNSALTINLRISIDNTLVNSHWVSTTSVDLATGSGWTTILFPVTEAFMTQTGNTTPTYADVVGACDKIRILSAAAVSHVGDAIVGDVDFDNITANTTLLSVKDNNLLNSFSISPNPGKDRLNLKLSRFHGNTNLEVFDVLGKKIFADRLTKASTFVDVSQWNAGVYLVRLTTDTGTQTKRFVKH